MKLLLMCFGFFILLFIILFIIQSIKIRKLSANPKNNVHFYVARDKDGDLTLWMGKPKRYLSYKQWYGCTVITYIAKNSNIRFYNINPKDYDTLKWEDEPVEVFLNLE